MIKLCSYGCGLEANHQLKNGKLCCHPSSKSCPEIIRKSSEGRKGLKRTKEQIKNISKSHFGQESSKKGLKYEEIYGKERTKRIKRKMRYKKLLDLEKIKKRYSFFSQIEEMRYNPDKPGEKEIQVHCKNHNCPNSKERGGWFTPTRGQIFERIRNLEKPSGTEGSYFYCSEKCKNQCPLFNLINDPFRDTEKPYTCKEYQDWRQKVLESDCYQCQYCGEKAINAHHEKPVKTHPHLALDPDNGISCCKECHYKYGHKTGTECSTGNLSKKVQQGCILGGQG
jgi:5-methylcytosine-specific restriction enzyme A